MYESIVDSLLAASARHDDATFLTALRLAYLKFDGPALDFAPFTAFWFDGAELPVPHRRWLVSQGRPEAHRFNRIGERTGWRQSVIGRVMGRSGRPGQWLLSSDRLAEFLDQRGLPESWQGRRDRWVTLVRPLWRLEGGTGLLNRLSYCYADSGADELGVRHRSDARALAASDMAAFGRVVLPSLLSRGCDPDSIPILLEPLSAVMPPVELATLLLNTKLAAPPLRLFNGNHSDAQQRLLTSATIPLIFEHPDGHWLRCALADTFVRVALGRDDDDDESPRERPELRPLLKTYSARYPDVFSASVELDTLPRDDPERVARLFRDMPDGEDRYQLLMTLLASLHDAPPRDWRADLIEAVWPQIEAGGAAEIAEACGFLSRDRVCQGIVALRHPGLCGVMPKLMLPSIRHWVSDQGRLYPPLDFALSLAPNAWDDLSEPERQLLLPLLGDAALLALAPRLQATWTAAKPKAWRDLGADWLKRRDFAAIASSGLLEAESESVFTLVTQALARHPDAAVVPWLRRRIERKGIDAFLFGLMLDRLEAAGEDVAAYEPESLVDARKASIPAMIRALWNEELARVFEPLGEAVGVWCLALIGESRGGVLSRLARRLIERLPPSNRAELATVLTGLWIADNGAATKAPLLAVLPPYGDKRSVDLLIDAAQAWAIDRPQKVVVALQGVAKIPGDDGAYRLLALRDGKPYCKALEDGALKALREIAEARGIGLEALIMRLKNEAHGEAVFEN